MTHGVFNSDVIAPRSKFYHGPFGRICPDLQPWYPKDNTGKNIPAHMLEEHFKAFTKANMVEAPGKTPTQVKDDDALRNQLDADFNSKIPAGYTYFGQFVDHDITLDTTPLSVSEVDPNRLHNFRTPRLDLDSIYGRGPGDQPFLYEADKRRLVTGSVPGSSFKDLQRNVNGRAIIGDMRNDENAIVSQVQLAFILAHNTLVQRAEDAGHDDPFNSARKTLRWLYQWIVWNDFIRRVTKNDIQNCALKKESCSDGHTRWLTGLKDIYGWKHQPFMPVEFSVAAYRFGHSMVRNSYQTNAGTDAGFQEFIPIFDIGAGDDLRGFTPLTKRKVVQWDWFLPMTTSGGPFPQMGRKIDTKLSNALAALPENIGNPDSVENILAARNLIRSVSMQLPSGEDVARKFGLNPVTLDPDEPKALWYYILKEAEAIPGANKSQMLGNVGSLIVCATFAGLLKGDPQSYINIEPLWTPLDDPLLIDGQDNVDSPGNWELSSVIRLSGLPTEGSDF